MWLAAAKANYASPIDWRRWADRLILSMAQPPIWLINASMARNDTELREAMVDRLDAEWNADGVPTYDDLCIGFLWLNYKRGQVSFADCLRLAAEQADGGSSRFSCEVFYQLLTRMESGERISDVESVAEAEFSSVAEVARNQFDELARS